MIVTCRRCHLAYGVELLDFEDREICIVCQRQMRGCKWTYLDDALVETMRALESQRVPGDTEPELRDAREAFRSIAEAKDRRIRELTHELEVVRGQLPPAPPIGPGDPEGSSGRRTLPAPLPPKPEDPRGS